MWPFKRKRTEEVAGDPTVLAPAHAPAHGDADLLGGPFGDGPAVPPAADAGPGPAVQRRPAGPPAWSVLPPLQRVVSEPTLTAPRSRLVEGLTSWRSPATTLAPLGHGVTDDAPVGVVAATATAVLDPPAPGAPPVQRSTDGPRLDLRVQRVQAPTRGLSRVPVWTGSSPAPTPVQRSSDEPTNLVDAPVQPVPTLTVPTVDLVSVPEPATAEPVAAPPDAATPADTATPDPGLGATAPLVGDRPTTPPAGQPGSAGAPPVQRSAAPASDLPLAVTPPSPPAGDDAAADAGAMAAAGAGDAAPAPPPPAPPTGPSAAATPAAPPVQRSAAGPPAPPAAPPAATAPPAGAGTGTTPGSELPTAPLVGGAPPATPIQSREVAAAKPAAPDLPLQQSPAAPARPRGLGAPLSSVPPVAPPPDPAAVQRATAPAAPAPPSPAPAPPATAEPGAPSAPPAAPGDLPTAPLVGASPDSSAPATASPPGLLPTAGGDETGPGPAPLDLPLAVQRHGSAETHDDEGTPGSADVQRAALDAPVAPAQPAPVAEAAPLLGDAPAPTASAATAPGASAAGAGPVGTPDPAATGGPLPLAGATGAPGSGAQPVQRSAALGAGPVVAAQRTAGSAGQPAPPPLAIAPLLSGRSFAVSPVQREADGSPTPSTTATPHLSSAPGVYDPVAPLALWSGASTAGVAAEGVPEVPPGDAVAAVQRATGTAMADVRIRRDTGPFVQRMNARALTVDGVPHVPAHLGPLEAPENRALVAHELTHVVQRQLRGGTIPAESSPEGLVLEGQARAVEASVLAGGAAAGAGRPTDLAPLAMPPMPTVQRSAESHSPFTPEQLSTLLQLASSPPAGGAAAPAAPAVQRAVADEPSPAQAVQRLVDPSEAAAGAGGGSGGGDGAGDTDGEIEKLADRLYPRIRRRLTRELRSDRERLGRPTDL